MDIIVNELIKGSSYEQTPELLQHIKTLTPLLPKLNVRLEKRIPELLNKEMASLILFVQAHMKEELRFYMGVTKAFILSKGI